MDTHSAMHEDEPEEAQRADGPRRTTGGSGRTESEAQAIGSWTRRYAQTRTVPVAVGLVVFFALFAALGALWHLTGRAYRAGNMPVFWVCVASLVPLHALVVWISVPRWGGKWLERLAWAVYGREGSVTIKARMEPKRMKRVGLAVALLFAGGMLGHVVLGLLGYLSVESMQPVSALYVVPFLVTVFVLQRPQIGYVYLLWPGLYGLHAALYVAGASMRFTGDYEALNMVLPMAGYGLVAALVGHVYNRIALRRIKRIGLTDEAASSEQGH